MPDSAVALQQQLTRECEAHAETSKELQAERAAHDETAAKMEQLQQRLEATLQELSNMERFTKKQQTVSTPSSTPDVESLLKEETYLKLRLLYVQQELADARGEERPDEPQLQGEVEDEEELGI